MLLLIYCDYLLWQLGFVWLFTSNLKTSICPCNSPASSLNLVYWEWRSQTDVEYPNHNSRTSPVYWKITACLVALSGLNWLVAGGLSEEADERTKRAEMVARWSTSFANLSANQPVSQSDGGAASNTRSQPPSDSYHRNIRDLLFINL